MNVRDILTNSIGPSLIPLILDSSLHPVLQDTWELSKSPIQSNILLVYNLYILLNPAKQSIMIWAQENFYMFAHIPVFCSRPSILLWFKSRDLRAGSALRSLIISLLKRFWLRSSRFSFVSLDKLSESESAWSQGGNHSLENTRTNDTTFL